MGKAVSQALCDRAELLSRSHELRVVAQIIGKCPSQISRMRKRGWKAADYASKFRPVPSDFAVQSNCMTHRQLVEHYGAGDGTIVRWRRELRG